ncbi:MAG TPA: mechanosensitive ion channel family protein [Pusillimonas sp.]|uniref:mechanosensitive ion channel family protein n=1 Tax=Pusillimonas sp. TaxID=3040095 RepID=UPI002CEC1AE5|nr:mechanosensitive ion channel family protein [Pusillimonas sp.]HUH87755.1 mechanosensitive ion channel family protein [Pusillimonas sp.]
MTKKPANPPLRRAVALWLLWPALGFVALMLVRFFAAYLLPDSIAETDVQAVRRIGTAGALYCLAWLLSRTTSLALARKSKNKRRKPRLLGELITAALFTVATIVAIGLLIGRPTGGILASSGLIIAILGFAIRNVLADVLAGIAIGLEAPYRIGDWVKFDAETSGRVIEIGWRTTRVLTPDGTYMILPNSHISRQMLTNYSAPRKHYQASLKIVLTHDVPVSKAKQILLNAVTEASDTVPPELQKPLVRASSYDPEGIVYTIKYWVPSFAEDVDRRDAMLAAIDEAIRKENLPVSVKRLNVVAVNNGPAD